MNGIRTHHLSGDIVESGIKHHNLSPYSLFSGLLHGEMALVNLIIWYSTISELVIVVYLQMSNFSAIPWQDQVNIFNVK
jgi:hypothetical protein